MKIGFPTDDSSGLFANINPQFRKCKFFTIIELDNYSVKKIDTIVNPNNNIGTFSEYNSVQILAKNKINIMVGEEYDPNTSQALRDMNIQRFDIRINIKTNVKNALDEYLTYLQNSNL